MSIPIFSALWTSRSKVTCCRGLRNTGSGRVLDPWISIFPMPQLFGYVAKRARERCVTRRLDEDTKRGWFYTFMLWAYGKAALQRFLDWEDSLSSCAETNANRLIETWPDVDLFVPLMIDYEYWFANSIDNNLGDQIDAVFEKVVLPHKGKIHPFVPFDPARELTYHQGHGRTPTANSKKTGR